VTDSAGAVGRATATITVIAKNTVPVITAPDRTIEVGSEFDALKGVTAKDEEDGVLTNIQVKSNGVNTEKIGEYEVRYEVTDSAGAVGTATATITVIAKNTIPVITAPDRTIEVGSKFNALEGVTAKDKEDGALTNIAVKSNNVDTAKIGEYEVRYEVVDSAGAVGTATAKISVVEIELAMPVVNEVLDTDNVVKGTAEKNTTLYLKMGLDYYEESVGEDGTFSSNLDTTYTAGTAIEAYVKDNDGRTSKTYKGSVQLTKIKNPYLEILTDTSKILIGRGRANTTLFVKIGEDSYEEDIPKTGLFKLRLDQTYPVGTPIEAYILDPVTNQESDITYAAVVPAEVISLNRVTSEDKKITGITIPNAHIKVSVYPKIIEDVTETDSRKRTYYGNSDDSGNFDIAFSIAYPADSKIEVEVTNPTTGRKFKKAIQIYPRKPTIAAVITGDRKVTGTGDQNAQIILTVNNQVYSPVLADEAGNYSINLTEALPSGAVVSVYQVVSGIKSEVAETTARP
ncbi:immunoglobulin-like domain-containing protein, partial [Carnobacterium gallinarum]